MRLLALALAGCSSAATARPAFEPLVDPDLQLLVTPSPDHAPFVHAIDGATHTIDLAMFHLTDDEVVAALRRAVTRGVVVRVILDGSSLGTKKYERVALHLRDAGVAVRGSSPRFSITHEKALVADGAVALVTAINLTKPVATTRDLGIVTHAPHVVAEIERVFAADWDNAEHATGTTPDLDDPSLVWSPINARTKLVALIASAAHRLDVTVENLGDPAIADALAAAVKRHVAVRLVVPMCDKNPDPLINLAPAARLAAAGVDVRMMPSPESAERPYMYSKMILADASVAYVGSVNFSVNSTQKARELGIIFANPAAATTIAQTFEEDWQHAVAPPTQPPSCSSDE